jgi:hypothetical protein
MLLTHKILAYMALIYLNQIMVHPGLIPRAERASKLHCSSRHAYPTGTLVQFGIWDSVLSIVFFTLGAEFVQLQSISHG